MSADVTVVCNAGPLIALGKINRLDLLAELYAQVVMPEAVYDEVVRQGGVRGEPDARAVRVFWERQRWPILPATAEMLARIQPRSVLGRGEMAVLALAMPVDGALVLLDDAVGPGRSAAHGVGRTRHVGHLGERLSTGFAVISPS